MNTFLEKGDYFPFISLKLGGSVKEMHNYVDDKFFLFVCVRNIEEINNVDNLRSKYNVVLCFSEGVPNNNIRFVSTNQEEIQKMMHIPDTGINVYYIDSNRKVIDTRKYDKIDEIDTLIFDTYQHQIYVPYLIIENVLSDELLQKILDFYEDDNRKKTLHNHGSKNRSHVHPDKTLEIEIDNKLSRSLFPEIKKIYYFDVKYREIYKICSYDAESNGRFHSHRDTPHPFQHRRYAMSLFLTDDYEGGEFELPEYHLKLKPKKNTALIFPGICSHKVNSVTKGSRKTMISFFCSEIEGKTKDNSFYKVKSNFFEENNIEFSKIYPL